MHALILFGGPLVVLGQLLLLLDWGVLDWQQVLGVCVQDGQPDALFPILTSVLSAAKEGRESRQSILSVISGVITDCGDNVAQDVVALLMKEQSRPGTQESILEEDKEIADLKDRLKCAMYSKLQDGSLEEAIDTASTSGGAMHFSDLPPLPPPPEEVPERSYPFGWDSRLSLKRRHCVSTLLSGSKVDEESFEENLSQLRHRTAGLLAQAADTGTLEKILGEVKKDMFVEVRKKVAGLLTEAANNGSLEKILEDVKDVNEEQPGVRQKAAELLSKDLRQTAASAAACLNQACQDGSLEKVLEQMAAAKEQSLDASRVAVAGLLGQAAEDGRLEQLLRSLQGEPMVYQDDVANIREAARESLLEAAFDGSLERVVSDLKIEKERQAKDGIRLKAAQLLEEAADSGALQRAVQEVKNDRSSGLSSRDKAAKLLEEAAESGQLQKVLQELSAGRASPRKETLAEVQKRTAHLLAQAADSGELERVLAKICPANEVELGIRSRVAQTLMEAAEDGRLHEALRNVRPQDRLAAVRSKVKQQLEEAALDGRLDKALQQLRQAPWHTAPSVGTWYMAYTPFDPRAPAELEPSLRQRLAQTLTQAAENGELESALLAVQDEA
ncbi:unnamed protein product [Effrenium voratum]|nr:unnamed protein product [Effrenium voratum]